MANVANVRRIICALASISLLVQVHLSTAGPLNNPDFTPEITNEVNGILGALLDEVRGEIPWPPQAREVPGFAEALPDIGHVGGVAVDSYGRLVIFHRGPVVWTYEQFNESNHYVGKRDPISIDTVLMVDPNTGALVDSWGHDFFYMPHGITVEADNDDIWLTDVAMQQVFKFHRGETTPAITLGEKFVPGSDEHHFCKPTSVAIAHNGDAFISDGYCNSRVMHFSGDGKFLASLGNDLGSYSMMLPHGIALVDSYNAVCVADREAVLITCMKSGITEPAESGKFLGAFEYIHMGPVYDIAAKDGLLFAITGSTQNLPASGFTIDIASGNVADKWEPINGFGKPHTIAVSLDGTSLYVGEVAVNSPTTGRVTKFVLST